LATLAERLCAAYGLQGWWPLLEHRGSNPTLTGRLTGYHPGDYSFPRTEAQRFEICCGAILTQNTAWPNVEKALQALAHQGLLAPREILAVDEEKLQQAIRPSGYFRAKARKLRAFLRISSAPGWPSAVARGSPAGVGCGARDRRQHPCFTPMRRPKW